MLLAINVVICGILFRHKYGGRTCRAILDWGLSLGPTDMRQLLTRAVYP